MHIDELQREFEQHLGITDRAAIPAVVSAMVANRLTADPFWLMLIGPPGCGKDVGALVDQLTQVRTLIAAGVVERPTGKPSRTSR